MIAGDGDHSEAKKRCTDVFTDFPYTLRRRLKAIIHQFFNSSFAGPKLEPSLPSLATLKLQTCNATGISVPFSRATCFVERKPGIYPMSLVFKDGFEILKLYLMTGSAPVDCNHRHILAKLLNFIVEIENEGQLHLLENCRDDASLSFLLTNHLFAKLSCSSQFVMNNHFSRKHNGCPCRKDYCELIGIFGDTSIGNTEVWHGNLDILLDYNLFIKTAFLGDSGDMDDPTGADTPKAGKRHVEIKKKAASLKLNQEIIAEVIVFSFLSKKLHPFSSHFLLPCIGVSNTDMVVYFYDAHHDVLLESCQFPLRNTTTGAMNLVTLIVIWLVLNYKYTCSGLKPYMMETSNFFTLAEDRLEVYQGKLRFGSVGQSDVDFVEEVSDLPWNPEGLKDLNQEFEEIRNDF